MTDREFLYMLLGQAQASKDKELVTQIQDHLKAAPPKDPLLSRPRPNGAILAR